MKMDNLEQFIRNNREDFDQEVPSLKVWAAIDQQLPTAVERPVARRISLRRVLSIAAAVTLLIGFGVGLGWHMAPTAEQPVNLSEVAPQYAEAEHYYTEQINQKMARLASYETRPLVQQDLEELDQWMQELRKELSVVPKGKQEDLVTDLIDLYRTKLTILDRLIETIQSSNQTNHQHETVDI